MTYRFAQPGYATPPLPGVTRQADGGPQNLVHGASDSVDDRRRFPRVAAALGLLAAVLVVAGVAMTMPEFYFAAFAPAFVGMLCAVGFGGGDDEFFPAETGLNRIGHQYDPFTTLGTPEYNALHGTTR